MNFFNHCLFPFDFWVSDFIMYHPKFPIPLKLTVNENYLNEDWPIHHIREINYLFLTNTVSN